MAGDWIKVECGTPDKPEVFEIAAELKISLPEVFGRLFLVWRLFDQQTEAGNAPSVTPAYIDHVAGVVGFSEAMRKVGWLAGGEGGKAGISLPDFDHHNGNTAKSRALTARRVATHKKRSGNDEVTHPALPREEKRRSKPPISPAGPTTGFEDFWRAWPKSDRKQSKGKCAAIWKAKGFEPLAAQIVAHVNALRLSADWSKEGGRYIPAPLVYLNQARWEGADVNGHDNPALDALRAKYGPSVRLTEDGRSFTDGSRFWRLTGEPRVAL